MEWEDSERWTTSWAARLRRRFSTGDDDHQENRDDDDDENGEFVRHRSPGREQLVAGAEPVGEADLRRDEDGPDDYCCGGPVLFETE